MAKFRNVTSELRFVVHGFPSARPVKPDEVIDVPDGFADAYAIQPDIWGAEKTAKTTKNDALES